MDDRRMATRTGSGVRPATHDSDHVKQTRSLREEFYGQIDPPTERGCTCFRAEGRRHMSVEIYGRMGKGMIHVRRLAWALAHPESHVAADEEVTSECGTNGDLDTGDGTCVNPEHLVKGKHADRVAFTRERKHYVKAAAAMTNAEAS